MIVSRKISVQAATALLAAVTLVCGLVGATASAAAAAVPSYAWATKGGGTSEDAARGVSALPDGSSIITGFFSGTASFGATILTSAGGSYDSFTAKVNADGSYAWATKSGGTNVDIAIGISALPDGSSIITGYFSGTAIFGATSLTSSAGSYDSFTAKLNADGSYAWATKGGGTSEDIARGVSVLPDGSSIITGYFDGIATFGATSLTSSAGSYDTFTAKLNADGSYAWATKAGGTNTDIASGVSVLANGSSIITGQFADTATFGATSLTSSAGSINTFTAKLNADGSYAWATKGGGTGEDVPRGVSALADGSSIITGYFDDTASFGATSLTSAGSYDTFTAKLNADGSYAWATKAGGMGSDSANGVSALADGSSIITGQFAGIATFGATNLISAGPNDSFTAKVNADGSYAWATKGGGADYDSASGVSALPDGSSIISGYFNGSATFGTTSLISAGLLSDAFAARILADAPQAPTGASASAGIREATITWNAVAGGLVSSYSATAAPGGASCTAVAPAVTCTITNLTAGSSYSATVTATNPQGTSPASLSSNAVTPTDVVRPLPSNLFRIRSVKVGVKALTSTVVVPGRGKLTQRVTRSSKAAAVLIVCKTSVKVTKAGTVKLTCKLSSATHAALRKRSLRVRVKTTFTPTGGLKASKTKLIKLKRRR